jgi:hypothetical protein
MRPTMTTILEFTVSTPSHLDAGTADTRVGTRGTGAAQMPHDNGPSCAALKPIAAGYSQLARPDQRPAQTCVVPRGEPPGERL